MKRNGSWLSKQAAQYGLTLQSSQLDQLIMFAGMVLEQAVPAGLSGRKTFEEILEKDILDSLLLVAHIRRDDTLLDIGSGAGFPGIPLKIAIPPLRVTLMEAKRKAAAFLQTVVTELELPFVRVEERRAEELGSSPVWRGCFDAVVGRAVAPMERFLPWSAPFVKAGGRLILQKGKKWEEELKKAEPQVILLGLELGSVVPGLEGEQKILVFRKK